MPVNFEPQKTRSRSGFDKNSVKKVGTTGLPPAAVIQERGASKEMQIPLRGILLFLHFALAEQARPGYALKQQILRFREGFAFHFGRDDWIRTSDP